MTKRILAVLLAVLMVLALVTGCSSGKTSSEPTSSTTGEGGPVDLSVHRKISIGIQTNTYITDYDDNLQTNTVEEEMNCDIEFLMLPAGADGTTKLQLMINGGDELPDIFAHNISNALTYQYGSSGTFVALNDWYQDPDVCPNFHAIESKEDKATMLSNATSADGNMYAMIMWQPEPWNLTPYRMYMNMQWLDNLDLDVPTDSDELFDVLKAFATEDPNGNGVNDEIPVLAMYTDSGNYGSNCIIALINMFVYNSPTMSGLTLTEDGKTIMTPQTTDEYREAMKYLNKLYKNGILIDSAFIPGTDTASFKGNLNYQGNGTGPAEDGKSINIVGFFTAGSNSGNFAGSGIDQNNNYLEYQMIPVPEGPDGVAYSAYSQAAGSKYWYVTEDAEDPKFCVAVGDLFYRQDMSMMVRYGKEGYDWTMDKKYCEDWYEQHTKLIEGTGNTQPIADYYSIVRLRADAIWGENNNTFWHNLQPRYASLEFFSHAVDYFDPNTFVYYNGNYGRLSSISYKYYGEKHPEYTVPVLEYTNDEQKKITEIQVQWPDLVLEWVMKFITGEKDPNSDADWQSWLDACEEIDLQTYIDASQSAYERTTQFKSIK